MKTTNFKLSTKFTLATALIVLVFCVVFSFLFYSNLKDRAIEDADEKTQIIMTPIGAV